MSEYWRFSGSAFPADGRGGGRACSLELGNFSLLVTTPDGTREEWSYRDLKFRAGGSESSHLIVTSSHGGSIGSVAIRDPAFSAALAERVTGREREFLSGFERGHARATFRKWRNLGLAAVASAGIALAGYWVVTDQVAAYAAAHLPIEAEVKWGKAMIKSYLAGKETVRGGPAHHAARGILGRLTSSLAAPEFYPLELHLVRDKTINAFAMPGGQMVLLTGLMAEAKSPEEVAGVLAHEIQHVHERHVVKRLVQQLGWRIWFSVIFGTNDLADIAFGAGHLMELSYGRAQEAQADVGAAKLLAAAGLPIEPLADFFDRLHKAEGSGSFPTILSTHPASAKRSARLRALARTLSSRNYRGFPGINWTRVRKAADGH